MRCRYCGYYKGSHALHCPGLTLADSEERKSFDRGYKAGRGGKPNAESNPAYRMGWVQGDSAADEATNSVLW